MSRVLVIANRLPITVKRGEGGLVVEPSSGGLATGLSRVHSGARGVWIGWPGADEPASEEERARLDAELSARSLVPVPLSAEEVHSYYEDFCNGVLWPLFHYLVGQLPLEVHGFELYETINRRFADAAAAAYRPGDVLWVHDYQLMLVPMMLRERLPDATIGFFLHIPFPSSDVFRVLPFRERLLAGLLGADLVGFHTAAYMRHFASAALRAFGVSTAVDRLRWEDREVRLGVFPMGVDAAGFAAQAEAPATVEQTEALRGAPGTHLLVGIDRLDYTKGIPRRLLAYECLLRKHPELRGRVRLIQVAVPSRTNVEAYQDYREQVDILIGRIHGAFATPSWVPIHYIYRGIPFEEVVALYRAADVMLVTPLRDGMNLVAKEFVASRTDESGALVLSEFAGAAGELAEAIFVNPYDVAGSADAYYRALTLPDDERSARMRALRRRVVSYDVVRWADSFLHQLAAEGARRGRARPTVAAELSGLGARLRAASHLVLLLDYDGTLVPIALTPELARPDPALLALLQALGRRPRTEVHVISGRARHDLERWLGGLPITLHGEHGLWIRPPGSPGRTTAPVPPMPWREQVLAILRDYAERTPGSLVEEKPAGLAWHYRGADAEFGLMQANELRLHLTELLSNTPVEILPGDKVIEIRLHGVNKARALDAVAQRPAGSLLVAFGDDVTDEDLFAALPGDAVRVRVGGGPSRAELRVNSPADVRALLRSLL